METVIVEIYLPSVNVSHDFVLPAHVPVGTFLPYLIETIRASTNIPIDNEVPVLCDMDTRKPLKPEFSLSQSGIRDSGRLMLV